MSRPSFPLDRADAPLFADGLGERVLAADATTGELLQVLRLRPELTAVPSFEFALRERTARLMNFRHAYYARVRRVDRAAGRRRLAIVSDHVEGTRLSDLLRVAHQRGLQLEHQRRAVPDSSAGAGGVAAARERARRLARADRARAPRGHAARAAGDRRARARIGHRAAAVHAASGCGRSSASRFRRRPAWRASTIAPTSTASASPRCRWCSAGRSPRTKCRTRFRSC